MTTLPSPTSTTILSSMVLAVITLFVSMIQLHSFRTQTSCKRMGFPMLPSPMTMSAHSGSAPSAEYPTESFDFSFADAMSKPLPEWFQKEKKEREEYIKSLEENRAKLLQEFKDKYEITELVKAKEREERWQKFKLKMELKKKDWVRNLFTKAVVEEELEETTRAKWEKVWAESDADAEEEDFVLPGFFEVFPELKFKWPIWSKRNGQRFKCETDGDCPFPQSCCAHPIIIGDKFCCTGYGRRVMVPAYAPQNIQGNTPEQQENNDRAARDRMGKRPWESLGD